MTVMMVMTVTKALQAQNIGRTTATPLLPQVACFAPVFVRCCLLLLFPRARFFRAYPFASPCTFLSFSLSL